VNKNKPEKTMKHRTSILRAIAALNSESQAATAARIRRRTLIPEPAIQTALVEMERDGLTEQDAGIWLTEAGWDLWRKDQPRAVGCDVLLVHADWAE
jgi:Mn-dependent DtxR family transcriptional regulator